MKEGDMVYTAVFNFSYSSLLFTILSIWIISVKKSLKDEEDDVVYFYNNNSEFPQKANSEAVGYDLFASHDTIIRNGAPTTVGTGITAIFPKGYYGKIESRSGVCKDLAATTVAGVIDTDYRGEIAVLMTKIHQGGPDIEIKKGDRIAQMILHRRVTWLKIFMLMGKPKMKTGGRGNRGFGSTGMRGAPSFAI